MNCRIRIIRPSSREQEDLLKPRLQEFLNLGFSVLYEDLPPDPHWPFTSASIENRLKQLESAILEPGSDVVWSARGGYGMSDLLHRLNWQALSKLKSHKLTIGFSDFSALQSALYAKLGWKSLHGPMPATLLWRKGDDQSDVNLLLEGLKTKSLSIQMSVAAIQANQKASQCSGKLFGGCLSVLTALIGTPFFPASLANHIIFLEDTGENPARMVRYFNQWVQSGVLQNAKAIVLGHFRDCCEEKDVERLIYQALAQRSPIPVFKTEGFGHTSPNFPLMIGAQAQIESGQLSWQDRWGESQPTQAKRTMA